MNFTVDDSDPSISYSANGWAVQSQNDPDVDQFFQNTYHVATKDQAFLVFQFSGTAFTLYGSKGPSHATFNVQYDGNILEDVPASASTTAFRQVLFTYSFGGNATQHLVNVTVHLEGQNKWFDLDYITFTGNSAATSSSSIGTATTAPPWLTSSSSTGPTEFSLPSSSSTSSSSSSSSSNKVPTILAALFGAILGIALLSLLAWLVLRRACARHRARERAFRYGQSSVNPAAAATAATTMTTSSIKGGVYPPSASTSAPSARSPHEASALMMRERTATPYSHTHSHTQSQRDGSFSADFQSQSVSMDERDRERVGTPATTAALSGASRGLMSQSPIAWTTRKMGGGHRGDADSLRTDFLQV